MDPETLKLLEALSTHGSNLGVLVAVWIATRAVGYALKAVRTLGEIRDLLNANVASQRAQETKLGTIHDDITRLPLELARLVKVN